MGKNLASACRCDGTAKPADKIVNEWDPARRLRCFGPDEFQGFKVAVRGHLRFCLSDFDKYQKPKRRLLKEEAKLEHTASCLAAALKKQMDVRVKLKSRTDTPLVWGGRMASERNSRDAHVHMDYMLQFTHGYLHMH